MNTLLKKQNLFFLILCLIFSINSSASETDLQLQKSADLDSSYIDPCPIGLTFVYTIIDSDSGAVVFLPLIDYDYTLLHAGFEILKMSWDFGDGATMLANDVSYMGHIYETPGTYEVCYTIWTTNGTDCCQETYCEKIVIESADPCAFLDRFKIVMNGDSTIFVASGWYGEGYQSEKTKHYWDFGDGTTSNGKFREHIYASPGTYLVRLTSFYFNEDRDICCTSTKVKFITIVNNVIPGDQEEGSGDAKQETNQSLNISPNPSNGQFTLTSESEIPIQTITVHNQTGGVVYNQENSDGSFSRKIDLSELDSGIYFVIVNQADEANRTFNRIVIK